MKPKKLFHRDFTLMIIGQIMSLFGNSILRFALSMYVLDKTGSAAAFGSMLAVSMIPTVLLSPIGGILADRVNRRNIMVALDFTTAGLITAFAAALRLTDNLVLIGCFMVILSIIQSFYQPSVQASVPALTADENLMKANGTVIQVNALASLVGPVLGGFLYGFLGIYPILIASIVCFFASAVMELFLHIPFTRQARDGSLMHMAGQDIRAAFRFLSKENRQVYPLLFVIMGLNLFLSAMVTVGLPYMIKVFLGLTSQHYGFAEGCLGVGAVIGGLSAGLFAKRVQFNRSYRFLLAASLMVLPAAAAIVTNRHPLVSYGVLLVSVLCCTAGAALFNIFAQTFIQQMTPDHLIGKVMSFVSVMAVCSVPLGQAMYGFLFDALGSYIFVAVLFAAVASIGISLVVRHILRRLDLPEMPPLEKKAAK